MDLYGVSSFDVEFCQTKINVQKEYLNSQNFITSSGSIKSLMDVSMSANLSSRYYAQLVNKVNTLQQVMQNEGLTPVFLTITHHGWLHDLYYGDYSRFNDDCLYKLPENDKYGYMRTKASKRELFDVHDLYMVLRWNWDRFTKTRSFMNMRKSSKVGYLFAVEPHDSGVPHAHVLLYVPFDYVDKLKSEFIKIFDAPMNITQDKKRLSPEQLRNGELNGFQWTITNPVGYILKYVTKSFMNIKNQEQLDELQAWYIKHRIVRFTTSHTLVPQWVYNKVYPLENDWLYLSELKNNETCEWSSEDDYFKFEDENLNKTIIYNRGLYQMFQNGELIREFGTFKEKEDFSYRYKDKFIIRPKKKRVPVYMVINGVRFDLHDKPIAKRGDWELYNYYNTLNPDICNLQHFGLVQNELIKRGLIKGEIQSLNYFNTKFDYIGA